MHPNRVDDGDPPIRVGVAGLGRSGWKIHINAMRQLGSRFVIAAVQDSVADRRREAEAALNCRVYEHFEQLAGDAHIDLVVVATPSHLHGEQSIRAMEKGKHVLCEKPMTTSLEIADRMIHVSRAVDRRLLVFQDRRFSALFCKVKHIIESGDLGRVVQIRMTQNTFGRRWDWQTMQSHGGGTLNNTGAHLLDQALDLFKAEDPEVFCFRDRALTLGDAEDHVVVMLKAPDEPLLQIEIASTCAYPQDRWLVMGTRGTLRGSSEWIEWKTTDWSRLPERKVETEAASDRKYNRDTLPWETYEWTPPEPEGERWHQRQMFYRHLYDVLRGDVEPRVKPEQVRRQIAILEKCRHAAPLPPSRVPE